jgi:hypothetical protein
MSLPKKKKVIILIIIVSSNLKDELDNENEGTDWEVAMNLLAAVQPQMQIDDEEWSGAQNAVWSAVEAMHDALSPEALGQPDMPTLNNNLATAIGNL